VAVRIDVAPHTGIQVYGKEYFWAGGIQKMAHEDFCETTGSRPVEILDLGTTAIPEDLFNDYILNLSGRYTAQTYDMLNNNCNNFTEECSTFLLGKSIPEHIRTAPEKVQNSCVGRIVLFICGLSPFQRTVLLVGIEWFFALIAMAVLLSVGSSACPLTGDTNLGFAIAILVMDFCYTSFLLTSLGMAFRYQKLLCCIQPWLESLFAIVFALLAYSAAIILSGLHSSMKRLYPDTCHQGNEDFRKLSTGVAFLWLLLIALLIARFSTRVNIAVHGMITEL